MMRFALIAALLAARCAAAPALTTIQDVLYKADGARFEGVAQIEWKSFQAADGTEVPQQSLNVRVVAGNLRVALVPTSNAAKPLTYTVKFNSDGRTQFMEYWSVAPSASPVRLKDVRTQPVAGNITSGSARDHGYHRIARGTGCAPHKGECVRGLPRCRNQQLGRARRRLGQCRGLRARRWHLRPLW